MVIFLQENWKGEEEGEPLISRSRTPSCSRSCTNDLQREDSIIGISDQGGVVAQTKEFLLYQQLYQY